MANARSPLLAVSMYAVAGGFADTASFLLFKTFTGHVTGNIILLAVAVANADSAQISVRSLSIACFLAATWGGAKLLRLCYPRTLLFAMQTMLLGTTAWLSSDHLFAALGVSAYSLALGLQNGVVVTTLGVGVHTTYLSGDISTLLTEAGDAGSTSAATSKRAVLTCTVAAFAAGGLLAALLAPSERQAALLLLIFLAGATLASGQKQNPRPIETRCRQ